MSKRTYGVVLFVFFVIVLVAIGIRSHGDGWLGELFRTLHGH